MEINTFSRGKHTTTDSVRIFAQLCNEKNPKRKCSSIFSAYQDKRSPKPVVPIQHRELNKKGGYKVQYKE